MKIIINDVTRDKLPTFLDKYSLLTAGFLNELVATQEDLDDLLIESIQTCHDQPIVDAIQLLLSWQKRNISVIVCGDYDCDGIMSTSLMMMVLKKCGIEGGYYIPNRLKEGYGTSVKTIQMAYDKGYRAVVMVDNGMAAFEALDLAKSLGMEIMVLDHHQAQDPIDVDCLVHPELLSPFFHDQCAAGVVFTLAQAMGIVDPYMTVLAGIATLADMMPLRHHNRVLVKSALKALNQMSFLHIEALLKRKPDTIDATTLSFQIVPVFNAVGRMADQANVNQVVAYLLSNNSKDIRYFARQLLSLNQERKRLSREMISQSMALVKNKVIKCLFQDHFHEGLVGIVAGQITSHYGGVTVVMTENREGVLKASVRGQEGFDVFEIFSGMKDLFLSFGGHRGACAFSLEKDNFDSLMSKINQLNASLHQIDQEVLALSFPSDAYRLGDFQELETFAPFGQGVQLRPVVIDVLCVGVVALGNAGYKLSILPIGDIQEVLVFKPDLSFEPSTRYRMVGNLSKNRDGLALIADYVEKIPIS